MSSHPVASKGTASVGKMLAKVCGAALIVYLVFLGVHHKWNKQYGKTETTARNQISQPVERAQIVVMQKPPLVYRQLAENEWSEKVNIMENLFHVWPASAQVEYECEDVNGNIDIRPGKGKAGTHNWEDAPKFQRVRSKKGKITYSVERR